MGRADRLTAETLGVEGLMERYGATIRSRTPRSQRVYREAREFLPGGTGRNATVFWPHPIYARCGEGSKLIDLDDNHYVDLSLDGGACVLGHAASGLLEAMRNQCQRGTLLAMATEEEVRLAGRLRDQFPFLEMMRFLNTGSEPAQIGIRMARAYTRKPKIAKFEGHHHGQSDSVLYSHIAEPAGPDDAPETVPDDAGLPRHLSEMVVTLPFNNPEASVRLIEMHRDELAAVLVEPLMLWGGAIPAQQDFLTSVRDITSRHQILLIVDEVPLGVRHGPGGAIGKYGIVPDIWTTGKALFGGLAHGLLGGRRDIFEPLLAPPYQVDTKVFCSGTFSANPLAIAAAHVVLDALADGRATTHMNAISERLRQGLNELGNRLNLPLQVTGDHSTFAVHFSQSPIHTYRDVMTGHRGLRRAFHTGLLAHGVLWPPGRPSGFVSTAHTQSDIDATLQAADLILREIHTVWNGQT